MQHFDTSDCVLFVLLGTGTTAVVRADASVASSRVGLAELAHH